jgi:hypothetical protein
VPVDADGIPCSDPLQWSADDVARWIVRYGPAEPDHDLIDAMKQIGADGSMLLNRVVPPDLFKIMRKWHLAGRKPRGAGDAELVSLTTLQETAILCYPYGAPQ